jgi:hypothetical protein
MIATKVCARKTLQNWRERLLEHKLQGCRAKRVQQTQRLVFEKLRLNRVSRVDELRLFALQSLKKRAFEGWQLGCYGLKLEVKAVYLSGM